MNGVTRALVREVAFLWRSPADLLMVTLAPLVLLSMLAWFLSDGVPRRLPIAVVDDDASPRSREALRLLDEAPALRVASRPATLAQAFARARSLDVYAVVYIPSRTNRQTLRAEPTRLFAYYNASFQTAGQAAFRDISAAVSELNARLAAGDSARLRRGRTASRPPYRVQATMLFNSARSYEPYLLGLLSAAILQFSLCLSLTSALGRELRDGSALGWLGPRRRFGRALLGKVAPYCACFMLQSTAALLYVAGVRGDGVHGSVWVLLIGQATACAAYVAIALLAVGATRNLGTALSIVSVCVGTSLAFSGATFPLLNAPLFARAWSRLLPFTSLLELQDQAVTMGSRWTLALWPLAKLALVALAAGALGWRLLRRAALNPLAWGHR